MPKQKLTLSIDAAVVERAKRFSRRHETSISELVTGFLAALEDERTTPAPVVTRLRGVLPASVSRDEYRDHLEKKYG